jgi:hypothetical protein
MISNELGRLAEARPRSALKAMVGKFDFYPPSNRELLKGGKREVIESI